MQRQQDTEKIMRDYLEHVKNKKDESGKNLVVLPKNFDDIIEMAIGEQKGQEELAERGLLAEDNSQISNFQEIISKMIQEEVKEPTKEVLDYIKSQYLQTDPYYKEKQKIKELDRVLAEKEKEYRARKNIQKMKKLTESQNQSIDDLSIDDM